MNCTEITPRSQQHKIPTFNTHAVGKWQLQITNSWIYRKWPYTHVENQLYSSHKAKLSFYYRLYISDRSVTVKAFWPFIVVGRERQNYLEPSPHSKFLSVNLLHFLPNPCLILLQKCHRLLPQVTHLLPVTTIRNNHYVSISTYQLS